MTLYKLNKKYKDRVFRLIFSDTKYLLQLYNGINQSDYTNPSELTITTMDDIVYMGMKNDISFIIGDVMNLYEHQSSFSPNLPLRGLLYFASLYREHIEAVKKKLYMDSPLYLPFPQYIVFYNGTKDEQERQELRLSDLFTRKEKGLAPALECTVIVLNINLGCNRELMERCQRLKEYAQFVEAIRRYAKKVSMFEEAVEMAVDECIREGILADVLLKNKTEVIDLVLTEWNEEEFREFLKEESWNKGHDEGLEMGIKGAVKLCVRLKMTQKETVKNLMEEYALSEEKAEEYVKKYWV